MFSLTSVVISTFNFLTQTKKQIFSPKPEHVRFSEIGTSIDDCLRKMEEMAGLPKGDLYIKNAPREVVTWPIPKKGLVYGVHSKTGDTWWENKKGYIAGDIFESRSSNMLNEKQLQKVNSLVGVAIRPADSVDFYGTMHISKNCVGPYTDGVCVCGDVM